MAKWCVSCEISNDYIQIYEFDTEQEALEYAEAQEAMRLWDSVKCYQRIE